MSVITFTYDDHLHGDAYINFLGNQKDVIVKKKNPTTWQIEFHNQRTLLIPVMNEDLNAWRICATARFIPEIKGAISNESFSKHKMSILELDGNFKMVSIPVLDSVLKKVGNLLFDFNWTIDENEVTLGWRYPIILIDNRDKIKLLPLDLGHPYAAGLEEAIDNIFRDGYLGNPVDFVPILTNKNIQVCLITMFYAYLLNSKGKKLTIEWKQTRNGMRMHNVELSMGAPFGSKNYLIS